MFTRKQTKELLPIMQAFAEGKIIQYKFNEGWRDLDRLEAFSDTSKYRIKPEPKYRHFKSQEECWNEMLKHYPFGWIKNKDTRCLYNITFIASNNCGIVVDNSLLYFDLALNTYNFVDGTPFGIKEE